LFTVLVGGCGREPVCLDRAAETDLDRLCKSLKGNRERLVDDRRSRSCRVRALFEGLNWDDRDRRLR
jgi:hypothetical protein